MRPLLISVLLVATVSGAVPSRRPPSREIENVAAFARLHGVVRYFYPSDAAASLDWNRFAVHGVSQARTALNAKGLEATLKALFGPLGPGIEIGQALPPRLAPGNSDSALIAWRYLGAGIAGSSISGPYKGKRTNRSLAGSTSIDGFISLMQTVPALDLRGKTIRIRGQVRATARDTTGSAALWLRVDRADRQTGFFDNMSNRPIRESEWREYRIEGTVADDATNVAFGAMATGPVVADFDAIDLAVRDADGRWTPVRIEDAGFEAEADTRVGGWTRVGSSRNAEITRPTDRAPEGRQFLRFSAPSSPVSNVELFESAPPTNGAHVDFDLGSGLRARVPLALSEAQARADTTKASTLDVLRAAVEMIRDPTDQPGVDVRLADVVVAWNVFRHFYPYWTESRVDWDTRLRPQLEVAYAATTREAQRNALRQLVADARDGHGRVGDTRGDGERAVLPLQLGIIDDRLVITASDVSAVPVGAVVSTIDGVPAAQRMAETMRLASGTTQWKRIRALLEMTTCSKGAVITLIVDRGTGSYPSSVRCEARQPPAEKRPEAVTELMPGLWYVDLTRASMTQVRSRLGSLASATGVVFDVRGYPTDAGAQILPHLIDTPESDRWMHVAKIIGPFGRSAEWQSFGWNLKPSSPRLAGKIVFLADARAISYAESVLGYVADRKLGTIVGSTTAGTNGNVAMFTVPGGFSLTFTGMRVTKHDGHTPHHLVGIEPDISIAPTIAALRTGRDDVLDRAVALIRGN